MAETTHPHAGTDTFETFFHGTHEQLFQALTLVTASRPEAEDISQIAFLRVLERWDRISTMENPEGFLYRVAMNEFRSRYRRAKRALLHAVIPLPPDPAFEEAIIDRDVVIRALEELTPPQRAALVLTNLLGYSSEEAGDMLGLNPAAVRALGSRARASIRRSVGEDG